MTAFTVITLTMTALLTAAMTLGGPFPALALVYVTLVTFVMDRLGLPATPDRPAAEFPAGDTLSLFLGLAHFPLLAGGVRVIGASPDHSGLDKLLLFIALALYLGQVSNSNAHELIHRPARGLRRLGALTYVTLLHGQHVSAHLLVHHVHAATDLDPNSARPGESFYRFLPRAWIGEFREGLRAETRRHGLTLRHPYPWYALGGGLTLATAHVLAGPAGLAVLVGLAAYAQVQLLLSDYVQHYGLRRDLRDDGTRCPVGPEHSWNAPQPFSAALMLNAPRHSDHHLHPGTPYPGLDIDRAAMPILPHALPVMAVLALLPPVWHRLMDKRARTWATSGQN